MKRKFSFLVAATMVLSMLPAMGVSAATANTVLVYGSAVASDFSWADGVASTPFVMIKDDSDTPELMGANAKFTLTLENAEFLTEELNNGDFGAGWSSGVTTVGNDSSPLADVTKVKTSAGYKMTILGSTVAEISNIGTTTAAAGVDGTLGTDDDVYTASGKKSLTIPLPVKMKGTGPAKVTIGGVGSSSYTEGTYTFAVGGDGTTEVSIKDSKTSFATDFYVPDITVVETVPATIKLKDAKQTIKFTAPNGFEWELDSNANIVAYGGFTGTAALKTHIDNDVNDDQVLVLDVSAASEFNGGDSSLKASDTSKAGKLIFSKLRLIRSGTMAETTVGPVNVKVTVSNGGSHVITVGEFAKKSVSITAEDKALPEIVSGVYSDDSFDESTQVLDVTIKETSVGAWNQMNEATFTLPEGVKFRGVEVKDTTHVNAATAIKNEAVEITKLAAKDASMNNAIKLEDDLLTLKIKPDLNTERMEVKLRCYVTVKPGFTGDIVFKTHEDNEAFGGELSAVVGKAINPFTVTAVSKDVQLGYMNIPLGDIIIKENQAGALKKHEALDGGFIGSANDVELAIGGYSGGGVGFKEKGTFEVLSGDIVVDKLEIPSGKDYIKLNIKRASTTASEVKLSGMTMDANRSVPEGKLELRISGSAVGNWVGASPATGLKDRSVFDVEYFVAKPDYVNIITAAPDKDTKYTTEVAVVVGGKSITANGVETTLEVAPFNKDGYVMVPTRAVATALGLKDDQILWNGKTKEVTILDTNRNRTSQFTQGSNVIKQAGMSIGFEGPSCLNVEGRTFLPFRALGEIVLGCPVSWDQATQTAYFNKATATAAVTTPVATPAVETPAAQ